MEKLSIINIGNLGLPLPPDSLDLMLYTKGDIPSRITPKSPEVRILKV